MLTDLIKESSFREVMYDLGFGEGEAKGRLEGEVVGLRESARAVLTARFGETAASLFKAIDALDAERLRELLPVCAAASLEEIHARLG